MLSLLATLQQADSAFPSGGFAFSNGVEGLAALGEPLDREGLSRVVEAALRHRWSGAERVALVRAFRAGGDIEALVAIDHEVEASTLAEPLRAGSRRNGGALLAAHCRIGTAGADGFRDLVRAGRAFGHLPVVQGLVWRASGLEEAQAVAASAYGTAAGLVAAAVRLGAIGAVEAQSVLTRALQVASGLAEAAVPADAPLSSFAPLIEIAAVRHGRADLKLFAN